LSISVGPKLSVQQSSTSPDGFNNSSLISVVSAHTSGVDQYASFCTKIEGFDSADFGFGTANAKTITLSFWVRSSLTGTFSGAFQNSGANRSYPFTFTINLADTFEYKTVTVVGETSGTWDTTNGKGIEVHFDLGSGSNRRGTAGAWNSNWNTGATGAVSLLQTNGATFYITGVQLEEGTVPTPFEHRPYGVELALCQRYYTEASPMLAFAYTATQVTSLCVFNEMRANPSVVVRKSGNGVVDPIAGAVITPSEVDDNFYIYDNKSVIIISYNYSGLTVNKVYWYHSNHLIVAISAEL
jgi:hypothetical protein